METDDQEDSDGTQPLDIRTKNTPTYRTRCSGAGLVGIVKSLTTDRLIIIS